MEQRNTTGILILLLTTMLVTAGCGLFAGNDYPESDSPTRSEAMERPLVEDPAMFRMVNTYYNISSVTPDEGGLPGGEFITLGGTFPAVGGAQLIYTVYFGNNIAKYNTNFLDFFTNSTLEVIAPAGDALGSVTLAMFDKSSGMYIIAEPDAYTYVDPFTLTSVDPTGGVLAGGTDVTVFGRIPVTAPITSLAEANAAYQVTFDGNLATFVPNGLGQYITAGAMYVQTPAGTVPGLVDVSATAGTYGSETLVDGYRYLGDFEILSLDPDNGHISGGNTVIINGSFPVLNPITDIATANSLYTVEFGGSPANFVLPSGVSAVITAEAMYVEAPSWPNAAVVDVEVYSDNNGLQATVSVPVANDYEYFTVMEIGQVIPDNGFVTDQTSVQVIAKLPITSSVVSTAVAQSMYQVEFDGVLATYDPAANPVIELTTAFGQYNAILHMFTPVGTVPGPVDVTLIDVLNIEPPSKLVDGYTYNPVTEVIEVVPNSGPTTGGTQVDVRVKLPSALNILDDVALADSLYSVDFGGVEASFDLTNLPLIQSTSVDPDYNHIFHMVTLPRTPAGFVDVTLIDETGLVDDAVGVDLYEYIVSGSLGQWTGVSISPNPVGPLEPGELLVDFTVTGDFGATEAFIVPQGGNPSNLNHRIPLAIETSSTTSATATNAVAITTQIYSTGTDTLFADGHAAIYLLNGADIIGDDTVDLTDGGNIGGTAVNGRHFIIDTLAPVQFVGASFTGLAYEMVSLPGPLEGAYGYDAVTRPFGIPTDLFGGSFPWSDDPVFNLGFGPSSLLSARGAQRFFNPMSISNGLFSDITFKPRVEVYFVDYDLSTHPAYSGTYNLLSGLNEDKFNPGDFVRAPSGFSQSLPAAFVDGESRNVLTASPVREELPARWELQGGSNASVDGTNSRAIFETFGGTFGGFVYDNGFDEVPVNQLRAIWDIYDGFEPESVTDPMRLVVKFAAADRAGIYYPRGDTGSLARAHMTPRDFQIDPLQIWWMREVNTQITSDNIPADAISRRPFFQWTIANSPRPQLGNPNDPVNVDNDPAKPQFLVELWKSTTASVNPDDYRNGSYDLEFAGTWTEDTLFDPQAVTTLQDNYWYLVSVMAADEAHNVERWPDELVRGGTLSVLDTAPLQGSNWRRFYYASENSEVDTFVTPTFTSTGGFVFGSRTVIPMRNNELVNALFEGRVETTIAGTPTIAWRLFENGLPIPTTTGMNLNLTNLGDPNRRQPYSYVLTATGRVNSVDDPTPYNLRFVIVPEQDITTYLTNRESDDKQPFLEFDRK